MLKPNIHAKNTPYFILFLGIFWILGIYFIKYYQYDTINRDLVVIISVAKLYAAGDFSNAVNGYWGPLFTWLLVPFIQFNSTPQFILYSTKIVSLIAGFFTIIGIRFLSYRFEMDEKIRISILFATIFVILYFALRYNPVDLLLACFLTYYLYFVFSPEYCNKLSYGAFCGIIGAMAYLTKSYAFPFFIAHFIMMNSFYYLKDISNKRNVLKNFILGLTVFFMISGAWSGILSDKYGEMTFGTSGKYNFDEFGPIQHLHGCPIWNGFMEPTNYKSISAWEDPSYFKIKSWNPLDSWQSVVYLLKLVMNNIFKLIEYLQKFSYFSMIILIIYLSFLFRPLNKLIFSGGEKIYPILTIILFCAGYLPVFVEPRYIFIVYILIMLMGGYLLNNLFKTGFLNNYGKFLLLFLFISSLIIIPAYTLVNHMNAGKEFYDTSNKISKYNIHGNVASNDRYKESLNLAYYLNFHYFGRATNKDTMKPMTDAELEENFKKYNIDYYLVWGNSYNNFILLSKYEEITNGSIKGLKIYKIRRN